jgi:membrane protease YdiL (CAAX protease family)
MNLEPLPSESNKPSQSNPENPRNQHPLTNLFLGPGGLLRPGWRLGLAASICLVISGILPFFLTWIPSVRTMLRHAALGRVVLTPATVLFEDGIYACAALVTGLVMTRIEKRSFTEYGLPWKSAFGARFWQGAVYGFAMISLLIGMIAALHGFSINGISLGSVLAVRYGLLYFVAFIAVGIFEEFAFRGYLQATLQLITGFWPAAIVLGAVFGAMHLLNRGESAYGAIMAGCFGLFAAFTLRRTGNLWFAIGLHSAWDWGETFFYSVRDSGAPAVGHLLNSDFHGPVWLTGGTVGPEGGAIVFAVLALSAAGIHFLFPSRRQTD